MNKKHPSAFNRGHKVKKTISFFLNVAIIFSLVVVPQVSVAQEAEVNSVAQENSSDVSNQILDQVSSDVEPSLLVPEAEVVIEAENQDLEISENADTSDELDSSANILADESDASVDESNSLNSISNGNGDSNPPPPYTAGTITICLMLADSQNKVATSSVGLPTGTFVINLATSSSDFNGSIIQSKTWTTGTFTPNQKTISGTENDSDCVTFSGLETGSHYYSKLAVNGADWNEPKYSDPHVAPVDDISDFGPYPTNSAYGFIILNSLNRTLVVLDTYKAGVVVNTPPVITLVGSSTVNMLQNTTFTDLGATATDAEEGNLTSRIIKTGSVSTSTPGTYTLKYTVTDSGGLSASTTRKVIVFSPIDLPHMPNVCVGPFAKVTNVANPTLYWHTGYTVNDAMPANYTSIFPGSLDAGDSLDSYWILGGNGNYVQWDLGTLTNNIRVYPILDHVFANPAEQLGEINEYAVKISVDGILWVNASSTATYFDDLSNVKSHDGVKDYASTTPFRYVRIDSSVTGGGDFEIDAIQSCSPINHAPTITLIGANPMNLLVGATFNDPGATATDVEDGNLTSQIVKTGTVNTAVAGTYTLTYTVTDTGGLSASVTRSVVVSNDNGGSNNPSVSLSANPSSITVGASSTLSWTSTNTNSCSAVWTTATSTSGSKEVAPNVTTEYSISCTGVNGTVSATTTVTVSSVVVPPVNPPNGGGGGGGGSSSGGRRHTVVTAQGEILGATSCSYLFDYLKIDWQNNPAEVLKLQSFLNVFEKENLSLTGVFDQNTFRAVERFQTKYAGDILNPWGENVTTGFVYILTKKKINEIYCNTFINLSQEDKNEIEAFRSGAVNNTNTPVGNSNVGTNTDSSQNIGTDLIGKNTSESSVVELADDSEENSSVIRNVAISLFALPQKLFGNVKYLLTFLVLIAVAVFIIKVAFFSSKDQDYSPAISVAKHGSENESPVIILPGNLPDEEIIIENPEEESEEKIS